MKTIAMLTSYGGQLFDPETACQGYGTELAVLETFSRLGQHYNIDIYISKPPGYVVRHNNINWKSSQDWDKDCELKAPEYVIILRYLNTFLDYYIPPESKILFYAHDQYFLPQHQGLMLPNILGHNVSPLIYKYVTVGYYQALETLQHWGLDMKKLAVIKNGITIEPGFDPLLTDRKPMSFIYSSCPTRGLFILLQKWNRIKSLFPNATLKIFYKKTPDIIEKFKPYENDSSIEYIGKVDQATLFKEMKVSDYWLYPCTYYETCCTTAFEMAYYGPISITSSIGGLQENVKTCLLRSPPESEEFWDNAINFIQKLESNPEEKRMVRQAQFEYAQGQTWDSRISQWQELFEN